MALLPVAGTSRADAGKINLAVECHCPDSVGQHLCADFKSKVAASPGYQLATGNTGYGIGAVESAFGAVDDFELVNIVEGLIGKIEEAAGLVEGRAVNEELGEVGVAAVEEESGETSFAAGASDGRARKSDESISERDELALVDFVCREDLHGSGDLADFEGLRVGGDDDIFRDLRDFEPDLQSAGVRGSQRKREFARDESGKVETNQIAPGGQN